jgi:hypothetical protein
MGLAIKGRTPHNHRDVDASMAAKHTTADARGVGVVIYVSWLALSEKDG